MREKNSYLKKIKTLNMLSRDDYKSFADISEKYLSSLDYSDMNKRGNVSRKRDFKSTLVVTGIFPDITHGGGLRVFDLLKEISTQGVSVDLYCPPKPDKYSPNIRSKYKNFLNRLYICKENEFSEAGLFNFIETNGVEYDTIIVIWPWTIEIISKRIIGNSRIVFDFIECTARRLLMDIASGVNDKKTIENFWSHFKYEKQALEICDGYIYVSPEDDAFIKILYGTDKKSILIPSYLHEGFLRPKKIRTRPLSACFIGNYEHYPNVDAIKWYLDRCHETILQKIPDYRFYIIGTGAKATLAKLQVRYKKFGESVQWIGEVKDPVKEISKYEICLAPLVTGAGFRGKVLQYSALGKVTVSTSIGTSGMPFIHGKSVLVADSELDFSAHVLTLLRNEKLRYRLAKKAQEISLKKYVWSSNIVSILTRLKKI